MVRPCYLVIDQEFSGSISTRKLVIETAKFNVITAYSGPEALDTLRKFPAVDGIVLDAGIPGMTCEDLVARLKEISNSIPVVVVGSPRFQSCEGADHFVTSFQPVPLLELLQSLQPGPTVAVEERNVELKNKSC
jgi:CheY-like chemotaxis protein